MMERMSRRGFFAALAGCAVGGTLKPAAATGGHIAGGSYGVVGDAAPMIVHRYNVDARGSEAIREMVAEGMRVAYRNAMRDVERLS